MEISIWIFFFLAFTGISECFILGGITTAHGLLYTPLPTTPQQECSIEAFEKCSNATLSLVNVTDTGVDFDREKMTNFYCGSENEYAKMVQCYKDSIDPMCGPDTFAASFNRSLSMVPNYYTTYVENYCRNSSAYNDLMTCQAEFSNTQSFIDCITGETLNKTVDPADTCNLFASTSGCIFKYTRLMCPNSLDIYVQYTSLAGNCSYNFAQSPEATSCDNEIIEVCAKAFKPPNINSTQDVVIQFLCSDRSLEYTQCVNKVADLCIGRQNLITSNLTAELENYKLQKQLYCSNNTENERLLKCQLSFTTLKAYGECLLGKEKLNSHDDFNHDDVNRCQLLVDSIGCSLKYTDLTCPEHLETFNNTINIEADCIKDFDMSDKIVSCEDDMGEACNVAFHPPDADDIESYANFICSGRAKSYATCLQKVDTLCNSSYIQNITVIQLSPLHDEQAQFVCSDKTGFDNFLRCYSNYSTSLDYSRCISAYDAHDACSEIVCNLDFISKVCPKNLSIYKTLNHRVIGSCGLKGTVDIHFMTSSDIKPYLSYIMLMPLLYTLGIFMN